MDQLPCETCLVRVQCVDVNTPRRKRAKKGLKVNSLINDCIYYREWFKKEEMENSTKVLLDITAKFFKTRKYTYLGFGGLIK